MGDMADYYISQQIDRNVKCDIPIRSRVKKIDLSSYTTWTTKDGRTFNIKDMETSHIINVLIMLNNKGMVAPSEMLEEIKRRLVSK